MAEEKYTDITEVCRDIGVTSRTLRFWEGEGLIEVSRHPFSKRRCFSDSQLEEVRRVAVLRSIGLSVSRIREMKAGKCDLSRAIEERRVEIIAKINSTVRELQLLENALVTVEDGNDIFASGKSANSAKEYPDVARQVTEDFISGNYPAIFHRFSERMKSYVPLPALERIIRDTVSPLGKFISPESFIPDKHSPETVRCRLRYEKIVLVMTLSLRGDTLHGFWMNYEES